MKCFCGSGMLLGLWPGEHEHHSMDLKIAQWFCYALNCPGQGQSWLVKVVTGKSEDPWHFACWRSALVAAAEAISES